MIAIVILINVTLLFLGVAFLVYFLYFFLVFDENKKKEYIDKINKIQASTIEPQKIPGVSILLPVHNEEAAIYAKLKNISELNYPKERIEVLVVDDCSTDKTSEITEKAFEELELRGKILRNRVRRGVNAGRNRGVAEANFEYVLTTDADVRVHRDALRMAVKILVHLDEVGGVTAKMIPLSDKNTGATKIENTYRDTYDSMLIAESAVFSTFPGYTAFALMRKSALSPISTEYGSSDGNFSLSIIKKGFRFICVPNIVVYEPISQHIKEQGRQKIRRAARQLQSTLMKREILFNKKYEEFGRFIFPLRFLMMIICPTLILFSLILLMMIIASSSLFHCILLLAFSVVFLILGLNTKIQLFNRLTSFLIHQIYLFLGLFQLFNKTSAWKPIKR